MKYNDIIHPLYKSIGEKLEKWLLGDTGTNCTKYFSGELGGIRQEYIILNYHFKILSYPTGYNFCIPHTIFSVEEQVYVQNHTKYHRLIVFTLGEKQ